MGAAPTASKNEYRFFRGLMPETRTGRAAFALILLVALALRLIGITWGLPKEHYRHSMYMTENETLEFINKIDMLSGDFDPDTPRPLAYNLYIGQAVLLAADALGLCEYTQDETEYQQDPEILRCIYLVLRCWIVLVSLLGLVFVFGTGRLAYGETAGLIAMALVAVTPIHVTESHFYTHQLRVSTYIAMSLYLCLLAIRSRRPAHEKACALASGLTGAVLINGLGCGIALLLIAIYNRPRHQGVVRHLFSGKMFALYDLFLFAFAAGIGGQWAQAQEFVAQWSHLQLEVYYRDVGSGIGTDLTNTLPYTIGIPAYLISIAAVIWAAIKHRRREIVNLSYFLVFFLAMLAFSVTRARYVLHFLPPLAVISAGFLTDLPGLFVKASAKKRAPVNPAYAPWVFLGLIISYNLFYTAVYLDLMERPLTSTQASEWMQEHLPQNARIGLLTDFHEGLPGILREGYFGPGRNYYPNQVRIVTDRGVRLPKDLDAVVTFDLELRGVYDKYLKHPEENPERAALAEKLLRGNGAYRQVAVFAEKPFLFRNMVTASERPLDLSFNLIPIRVFVPVADDQ